MHRVEEVVTLFRLVVVTERMKRTKDVAASRIDRSFRLAEDNPIFLVLGVFLHDSRQDSKNIVKPLLLISQFSLNDAKP